jgi:threonine dehydrogenase-like Zn-dependent dehydrogenase
MKAVTFTGTRQVRVADVAEPKVQEPHEAIVRINTAAICGSDLHLYHGRLTGVEPGTIIGHEYVGIVEEVGSQVSSIRPGDRVVGSFHTACGHCWYCRQKLYSQCVHCCLFGCGTRFGNLPGTQAELARIPHADFTLHPVPDDLSDEQALFAGDILSTAYFCAERGNIQPGDTVAVVGCGPVGLCVIQCAKVFGAARVIALDMVPARLQMAKDLGADPVDVGENPIKAVKALTGNRGADVVLEAVGSEATLKLAFQLARGFGTISAAGVFTEEALPFPAGRSFAKDLTLRVGMANVPAQFHAVLELLRAGRIDPTMLITHTLSLNEAPYGYDLFDRKEAVKVILKV